MRVAFDVSAQASGMTGIARYQAELAASLGRAGVEVARFAVGWRVRPPAATRHVPLPSRLVQWGWRLAGLPPLGWVAPPADLVHLGLPVVPPSRRPVVVTVHDLDALDHPHLHPLRSTRQLAALLATLPHAAAVIASSRHVADVLAARGVDPARVTVVHHGVAQLPQPVTPPPHAQPYLLAVGQLMPRKGFDVLVEAFARARPTVVGDHRLVIAGPPGIAAQALEQRIATSAGPARVVLAGPVTDAELAGLYAGATAVCVPSRAEGFGLPLLEAMAAGAPVLASDIPVFREVADRHAGFVPAGDVGAWTAAIEAVVADGARAERIAAGKEWAATFTWERAAIQTADVYRRVLAFASP